MPELIEKITVSDRPSSMSCSQITRNPYKNQTGNLKGKKSEKPKKFIRRPKLMR